MRVRSQAPSSFIKNINYTGHFYRKEFIFNCLTADKKGNTMNLIPSILIRILLFLILTKLVGIIVVYLSRKYRDHMKRCNYGGEIIRYQKPAGGC